MYRHLLILAIGLSSLSSIAQTALVQLVHSSADSALNTVDIWLDTVRIANNLSFRNATKMKQVSVSSSGQIISICPSSSTDTSNALFQDSVELGFGGMHQLFVSGYASAGYTPSPPLSITIRNEVRTNSNTLDHSDFWFYNGCSDLQSITLEESTILNQTIYQAVQFDSITNYISIEGINYLLRLKNSSDKVLREFEFNISDLGLRDSAFTLVLSGFAMPSLNNNGPIIRLDVLPLAGGPFIPLEISMSEVQFINNAVDPSVTDVDIYVNENQIVDNLKFRFGTDYLQLPSGVQSEIVITPGNGSGIGDSIVTLAGSLSAAASYVSVIQGQNTTGLPYFQPMHIIQFASEKEASNASLVKYIVVNGIPDIASCDIVETSTINENLVSGLEYNELSSYAQLAASEYNIEVSVDGQPDAINEYALNFLSAGGSSQTWVLSGIADSNLSDSTNSAGIWVIENVGGPLKELSSVTNIEPINSPRLRLYPNPSNGTIRLNVSESSAEYEIFGVAGDMVQSGEVNGNDAIDLHALPAGFYVVRLTTRKKQYLEPIILDR